MKAELRGGTAGGRDGINSVFGGDEAGPGCHVRFNSLECLEDTEVWARFDCWGAGDTVTAPRNATPAHEVMEQINAVMIFKCASTSSSGSRSWRFPIVPINPGLPPAGVRLHRPSDVVGKAVIQLV